MSSHHSRRSFLGCMAVALTAATPALLYTCRRKRSDPVDVVAARGPLDEVENAATFRPPIPSTEPVVRVRVLRVRDTDGAAAHLQIGEEGQWLRVSGEHAIGRGVALSAPVHVAMTPAGWSVTDAKGFRPAVDGRESLGVSLLDGQAGGLWVHVEPSSSPPTQKARYPGTLQLVSRHDLREVEGAEAAIPGAFDVINHVPIESYLPGVLAGELYNTWHLETFAAQCIAARSFACTEAAVFAAKRHYDLTNTAASQMYLGGDAHMRAKEAAAMTRGLVLAYESLLVSGYYSSCCGGAAAAAVDAIGSNPVNDLAPLQGRSGSDVCTGASVFSWTVQQPIDALSSRLAAYGQERRNKDLAGLGRLASIDVVGTNPHGRPTRFRVVDDRDLGVVLPAEELRRAANYSGRGVPPPAKPLRSSHVRATFSPTTVTFEGNGFGHGVGLCQYGAEALARGGMRHADIVSWYYPGVELAAAYP